MYLSIFDFYSLKMTFLLIDGHGPNTVDAARFEMINAMNINYCVCVQQCFSFTMWFLLICFSKGNSRNVS